MAVRSMTAAQIAAAVTTLRDDSSWATMRAKILRRHALHEGTDLPTLPDHMHPTGYSYLITKRLSQLTRDANAFMASYPTTTTVYPEDRKDQHKADEAEKRLAVLRANLFPDKTRSQMRWHQFITAYGVYKLCCYDSGETPQWGVEVIDPSSIYFPNPTTLPNRPKRCAREYTMEAAEIKARYGQERQKQPEHNDGSERLTNNAGFWKFEPISREVASEGGAGTSADVPQAELEDDFGPVTVMEYSTEECTYICVKNKPSNGGREDYTKVWQYEHLFKGTPYVVVPGDITGSSQVHERILPYFNAVMMVLVQINFIRTALMTSWTSARFQVAVEGDPELLNAAESLGIATPATPAQAETGRDVIYFAGKPYFYAPPTPETAKILLDSAVHEYNELASSELSVTTAEVTQQATVRGQQLAVGQREKQKTLLLSYEDEAEQMILRMVVETITAEGGYVPLDDQGWGYFSPVDASYGKGEAKKGERVTFNKESFDFAFEIAVTTASKTEEDRQRAFEAAVMAISVGLGTIEEALDAKGIQDIEGWLERKAEDDAYKTIAMTMGPNFVLTQFQKLMRLEGDMNVRIPGLEPPVAAAPQMNPQAGAFPPPQTEGVGSTGSMPAAAGAI